jgi:hypothetical protein
MAYEDSINGGLRHNIPVLYVQQYQNSKRMVNI